MLSSETILNEVSLEGSPTISCGNIAYRNLQGDHGDDDIIGDEDDDENMADDDDDDVDDDEGAGQVPWGRLSQQGWGGGGEGRHDWDDQVPIKLTQSNLKPVHCCPKFSKCFLKVFPK